MIMMTRATINEGETVEFMVYRFDPAHDKRYYYVIYEVPYHRGMTVLDGLLYIIEELDPSLSLRFSCRFKICGSCAVMVNGVQRLGCGVQVSDVGRRVRVDPLAHFVVLKDLVVDIDPFLEKMEEVMPYLEPKQIESELRVPMDEFERYRSPSDCIWCGACASACPIMSTEPYYLGPAALTQLYRFNVDSRENEEVKPLRLIIADSGASGVWRCHQVFACTSVCPKNIDPGAAIAELKRMILKARLGHRL